MKRVTTFRLYWIFYATDAMTLATKPILTITEQDARPKGRKEDVIPRRLLPVAQFLREEAGKNDSELEEVLVITLAGMREGKIPSDIGQEQLYHLFNVFVRNADMKSIAKSLCESVMDVSLIEVDAILKERRETKEKKS